MTFWHLIVWQVNRYSYHPPNLFQPLFCVRDHCGTKLIKGYAEPSMIRLLHVDQGKLSKCGHNNMLETVISWTHCILDIGLVSIFQLLKGHYLPKS